jgi:hypothetical protein
MGIMVIDKYPISLLDIPWDKNKEGFYAAVETFFQLYTITLIIICNRNHQLFYIVQSDFVEI